MMAPKLQTSGSIDGLWSSLVGGPGVVSPWTPTLPVPLASALQGALNVDGPQDGAQGATPRDTRTKQQRAADDAAGLVYDPATGTYRPAASAPTDSTQADNTPSWYNPVFDIMHPLDSLQAGANSLLVRILLLALGGGLVYLGVKTLTE